MCLHGWLVLVKSGQEHDSDVDITTSYLFPVVYISIYCYPQYHKFPMIFFADCLKYKYLAHRIWIIYSFPFLSWSRWLLCIFLDPKNCSFLIYKTCSFIHDLLILLHVLSFLSILLSIVFFSHSFLILYIDTIYK